MRCQQPVCPSLGVLFGFIMFLAPVQDCYRALIAGKGLGDLNPMPWAFMLGNCIAWVTYSVLIQNYFVFFGNAPAILLAIWLNLQASKMQVQKLVCCMVAAFSSNNFVCFVLIQAVRDLQIGRQPEIHRQNVQ